MSEPTNRSVPLCGALRRLRFVVVVTCWVISLSLTTQMAAWSLASFTDLRYGEPDVSADTPLIITAQEEPEEFFFANFLEGRRPGEEKSTTGTSEPVKEQRALGPNDRTLEFAVTAARGLGMIAALMLCPLLMLGIVLAVPAGAANTERAVSAVAWAMVLVLVAMPLSGWFGLPWQEGTLSSYGQMMTEVEAVRDGGFTATFFMRFLLMPAISVMGFIVIGFRFSGAVASVLLSSQAMRLDPVLEKEAANVSATSLHGAGRSAGALQRAMEATAPTPPTQRRREPVTSRVSAGEVPRRLI